MGCFITRTWRMTNFVLGLFILEFFWTIAMLTLAGVADPNTYRTKLWQNGADRGFNGDPSIIMYSYANYKPIATPVVWSHFLTQYNVIISVLSMFVLLTKSAMFILHAFVPLLSVIIHLVLLILYAISVRNQSAPDMTDLDHPSPGMPWMMSRGCSYATDQNRGYCQQAVAQFGVTIVGLLVFTLYLIPSIYSCFPTPTERAEREDDIELKRIVFGNANQETEEERNARWDQNRQLFMNMPKTPATPFQGLNPMTPRTVAFTALNGQPPTAKKPTFSSRELPLRQYSHEEGIYKT
ncbi:hypothetical protein K431DRAFT_219043 [Polychaeton citri CBS 116435]|uniref:Uncharacterized protein n=1 Tax=Polychaeton citri CBS 116435 TaxID=1314669 RepID=A0A9P4UPY8_9PEZI|nr:hypothetical protein K431DRAFT_219043 [Polychaeton citri CBS 116435]